MKYKGEESLLLRMHLNMYTEKFMQVDSLKLQKQNMEMENGKGKQKQNKEGTVKVTARAHKCLHVHSYLS